MKKLNILKESLKCNDRVVFKEMAQDEIREYIKKAYLCFSYVPSNECYQDQFVLKNIEYLACGRPVLSTHTRYNKGFQTEVGKRNILLCEDKIREMAAAINSSDNFVNEFYKQNELNILYSKINNYSNKFFIKEKLFSFFRELKL